MPLARRLSSALAAMLIIVAGLAVARVAVAQTTDPAVTVPLIKAHQRYLLLRGAQRRMTRAKETAARVEAASRDVARAFEATRGRATDRITMREALAAARAQETVARPGAGRRPFFGDLEAGGRLGRGVVGQRREAPVVSAQGGPPTNVRVSTATGDAGGDGQAEQDLAVVGNNIVVAWNDGHGFTDGTGDTQGYGYSTDGGTTFTDGGKLPKPTGFPSFIWTSDPIVTANEKTGEFWYAGLCSPSASHNGLAVVKGTFSGPNFNWGNPVIIRNESDFQFFIDKPWMVADTTSGNLYLTYTEFNGTNGDEIDFKRSTDGGTTWSNDIKVNYVGDDGAVQGSRPCVGPNGEVHVVYYVIGTGQSDLLKHRVSVNNGLSFSVEHTVANFFTNFGTGAPGFNREIGIQFPSIAVDRSQGPNRGRVYVAWNESINWLDELFSTGGGTAESEPNNTTAQATPMTIGQPVTGTLIGGATGELDYFSFSATQNTTYVFWCDQIPGTLLYTMRIFCSNGTTTLAYSGAPVFQGDQGFIVWTAPSTGTYYLRMANTVVNPGDPFPTGTYRVLTTTNTGAMDRARDQRDVFVASSSNNGTTWDTPVMVNDDLPHFDDWLPEVEVLGNGTPVVIWYDWRDAAASCGGLSHVYMSRSDDGGGSWVSLGPVTTVQSNWTTSFSNIAPNQGDYLALFANGAGVYPCWADARNGDPDIYFSNWSIATPVQIALATVSATPDRVSLAWFSGGDRVAEAVLERNADSVWEALATLQITGEGRFEFTDQDVLPGGRYGYRLRINEAGNERVLGETWVDVPQAPRLAIAGIRPNPSRHEAWLTFSLDGNAPATVTVLDIAGRVIREREVGSLGAGSHQLNLAAAGPLAAGVYLVRLTQGTRSVTARMSVVK